MLALFCCTFAGRVIVIVIAAVSAAVALITGAVIAIHMWKNRIIEKKRRGNET